MESRLSQATSETVRDTKTIETSGITTYEVPKVPKSPVRSLPAEAVAEPEIFIVDKPRKLPKAQVEVLELPEPGPVQIIAPTLPVAVEAAPLILTSPPDVGIQEVYDVYPLEEETVKDAVTTAPKEQQRLIEAVKPQMAEVMKEAMTYELQDELPVFAQESDLEFEPGAPESLDFIPAIPELITADSQENIEDFEFPQWLPEVVSELEPEQIEAVEPILVNIVELVQNLQALEQLGSEADAAEIEIVQQALEQWVGQLLEQLEIEPEEIKVAQLINLITDSEFNEKIIQKLSADELNNRGTREYKLNDLVAAFNDFLQDIKQRFKWLGRYLLQLHYRGAVV